jgi:hypothetical protein
MKLAAFIVLVGVFTAHLCGNQKSQAYKDRKLREHLSERQIDKMVEDSFPASDPPSTY